MRIAMVSEHASPLAALGGVDAGGQNVHVAALAAGARPPRRRGRRAHPARRPDAARARRDGARRRRPPRRRRAAAPDPQGRPARPHGRPSPAQLVQRLAPTTGPTSCTPTSGCPRHAALLAARDVTASRSCRPSTPSASSSAATRATTTPRRPSASRSSATSSAAPTRSSRRAATRSSSCVRLGAPRSRLTVVPCGVDLDLFTPDGPREPRDAGPAAPAVRRAPRGAQGHRQRHRGARRAARHRARRRRRPAAPGELGERPRGAAPAGRSPSATASPTGSTLRGRVGRADLPRLLRSADVVVCAPWYEPFGIVPLEAMACGVPVVASAVGGMIDTVVDGVTGVHVPPRDPDRAGRAPCARCSTTPSAAPSSGAAGVRRARRLYAWERVARGDARRPRRRSSARRSAPRRVRLPSSGAEHLAALRDALGALDAESERLEAWGRGLAERLLDGGRLLAVGNGGSAAQAQHLTAELVGRYQAERRPLSALCLHGDASSFTAIGNDYGARRGLRPPGARARPPGRRARRPQHVRAQRQRARRRRRRAPRPG